MFRDMRRKRQELSKEGCVRILEQGKTAVLSVAGDDGYPYGVPVNYVYADGRIFFHCAKSGHKLDGIRRCEKVSLCVVDRDDVVAEELTTYFRSVILFGRARILETEEEIFRTAERLGLKYNPDRDAVAREIEREKRALCCVEITVEHMTGKEAIELLREREAGREKS